MTRHPAWYLCLCLHNYSIQAYLRFNQGDAGKAVVIIEGTPSTGTIISVNKIASLKGLTAGMSSLQASLVDDVMVVSRSINQEQATRSAFTQLCMQLTPLIEDCSSGDQCVLVLDVTASRHMFTSLESMAKHLASPITALNLQATSVVSCNFHTSRLLAQHYKDNRCICIPAAEEPGALSHLPVTCLPLTPDQHNTFTNWGIHSLRDLAALPLTDLVSRMGQQSIALYELAKGKHSHVFEAIGLPKEMKESVAFDTAVDLSDSLLFSISSMLKQLIMRAETELASIDYLTIFMSLQNKTTRVRTIRPAIPSTHHTLFLKLIQLDISAHPPLDSVLSLTISASLGHSHKVQMGMFSPQSPEAAQLHVTLARIAGIVGQDHLGSPLLENSHRQLSTEMNAFSVVLPHSTGLDFCRPPLAMTRMRSGIHVSVMPGGVAPSGFTHMGNTYRVSRAYGPWNSNGQWWASDLWNLEQWDVIALEVETSQHFHGCLSYDRYCKRWFLEGIYD